MAQITRLAEQCDEMMRLPAALGSLRVTQFWAIGDVLGPARQDLEWLRVAAVVDLPVDEVPWWCAPVGASWWCDRTRASKNPVTIWWRSAGAPVWNHRVTTPLLVWDEARGIQGPAVDAIRDGRGASLAISAPTHEEYVVRMQEELSVSLDELRRRTLEYEAEHTTRLGIRADALFDAARGYLDVLDAQPAPEPADQLGT